METNPENHGNPGAVDRLMALRWPKVSEAWMYRDPQETVERSIAVTERAEQRAVEREAPRPREQRDRHHIRGLQIKRRESLKRAMKGKR